MPTQKVIAKADWPLVSLALATVLLISPIAPFPALSGTGYHDGQRVLGSLFFVFALVIIIFRVPKTEKLAKLATPFTQKLWLAVTLFGVYSASLSVSVRHGFYELATTLGLLFVAAAIASEVRAAGQLLDKLLLACGVSCSLYVFQALTALGASLSHAEQATAQDLIIGFDNYRFLNHVQTIGLPLLGLLVVRSSHPDAAKYANPIFWKLVLSLSWMLTFVSAGRGTFFAVWVSMFVVLALFKQAAYPWFRAMALTCLAGLTAYLILYVAVPLACGLQPFGLLLGVVQRTANAPDSSRWALWKLAAELIAAHPLLGVGPLHFAHYASSSGLAAHPHNFLLQIASEWGLPALFALLCIVYVGVKKLTLAGQTIAQDDLKNQAVFVAFLATAIAISLDSMVSGLMVMPSSQLWITLYFGCAWGWTASRLKSRPTLRYSVSWQFTLSAILVVFWVLACVFNGLWPEVLDLPAHEVKTLELEVNQVRTKFNPRIWRAGYF